MYSNLNNDNFLGRFWRFDLIAHTAQASVLASAKQSPAATQRHIISRNLRAAFSAARMTPSVIIAPDQHATKADFAHMIRDGPDIFAAYHWLQAKRQLIAGISGRTVNDLLPASPLPTGDTAEQRRLPDSGRAARTAPKRSGWIAPQHR